MERQGSGFQKITDAYHAAHSFRADTARGNTFSKNRIDKKTARYQRKADSGQFVRHMQVLSK